MTEAALALSEQKNHNMAELLTRVKAEKEEQRDRQSRERQKEQEVGETDVESSSTVITAFAFFDHHDLRCSLKQQQQPIHMRVQEQMALFAISPKEAAPSHLLRVFIVNCNELRRVSMQISNMPHLLFLSAIFTFHRCFPYYCVACLTPADIYLQNHYVQQLDG